MGENTLSVKITADVVDLQTKFVTAKAEVAALTKEMSDLAKQSAQGILDPSGLAQLQDVSRQFLEAKQGAAELAAQLKATQGASQEASEEFRGIGGALEEMHAKISGAFEISGVAAAFEAIKSIGEEIEQLGEQATHIHAMAEILGVTTDQFQAMQAAAKEGGTSIDSFSAAGERLVTMLTQARDGSSAAEQKLFNLGVSLKQIEDPAFGVNELFQVLHDRLNNTATAQETMNELTAELGRRFAAAAEAIKVYDGSFEGVNAKSKELNFTSKEHIQILHEMGVAVDEAGTRAHNFWSGIVAGAGEAWEAVQKYMGVDKQDIGVAKHADEESPETQQAQADAVTLTQIQHEIQQQELANIRAGVEAYKEGSAQKLAQLQELKAATVAYYGADSDAAAKAQERVIAEERSYAEQQGALREQQVRAEIKADDETTKARLAGIKLSIDANEQYFAQAVQVHEAIRSMEETGLQLQTQIYQQRAKLAAQTTALNAKETQEQLKQWQAFTSAMSSGLTTAFKGMLTGGESFGTAMRNMFVQVGDAAAANVAKNIASMIQQAAVGKGLRSKEIQDDAGAAAAGAYKAIVGIPYVGPFLAPAAAAVAYAGVLAFDSAAGGYDIPSGLNPVVQTHSREMILPAPIADTVRNAVGQQGSGQNGSGGRAGTVHIHGKPESKFTGDQLASMLKELGYRFKFS
jgi:hypothetical protein